MSIAELIKTQSNNNVVVAEKFPKVYQAGQFNPVDDIKKEASGSVIRVDDVSNVEHSVGCNVSSKNLLEYESDAGKDPNVLTNGVYNGILVSNRNSRWYSYLNVDSLPDVFTVSTYAYCEDYGSASIKQTSLRIYTYDANKKETNVLVGSGASSSNPRSYITCDKSSLPSGTKYIRLFIRLHYNGYVKNSQIELGSKATAYTPYITDFSSVKVSRYGKNLINYKDTTLSNATAIEKLENGIIAQGNLGATQPSAYANGWVNVNYGNAYKDYQVKLNANDIATISCDYTLLELAEGRTEDQVVNILLYGTNPHSNPDAAYNKPKLGKTIRLYATYTIMETGVFYPIFSLNSNLVKIENIQIELGSTQTAFEEYKDKQTVTANADGTVDGITSVAPNMTLLTDTEGVIINCEYYNYINLLSKEKYEEGHTEGYETGHTEGYEKGRSAGYDDGFTDGYKDGTYIGFGDGFNVGKEEGIVEGKQAEHDAFWDVFQKYGNRTDYNYAFGFGFTNANFYPKYDIIVKNYCTSIFYALEGGSKFSLIDRLNNCGVKLDTSKATNLTGLFSYANKITGIPTIDCTGLNSNSTSLFANLYTNCKTIEKIITKESVTYKNWFTNTDVTNVTFEGVIGQDLDMSYGSRLTAASMNSIISCLKDYSGTDTTHTLSLGSTKLAKLSDAEKAIATEKGWTLV